MSREVRKVPASWQHPKDGFYPNGQVRYAPLHDGFMRRAAQWDEEAAKWAKGVFPDYADEESKAGSFESWEGSRPDPADYMPDWPESERTHFVMYEITSEGTPISPAFATPEELAQWLTDNSESTFGGSKATYEQWLRVCKGTITPTLVIGSSGQQSGFQALDND